MTTDILIVDDDSDLSRLQVIYYRNMVIRQNVVSPQKRRMTF